MTNDVSSRVSPTDVDPPLLAALVPSADFGAALSKRDRSKLENRMALRVAAIQLFTVQGFDDTSVEQIAVAAGVSTRTFFNYFPTKESAVAFPAQELVTLLSAGLRGRPAHEGPFEAMRRSAAVLFADLLTDDRARNLIVAGALLQQRERALANVDSEFRRLARAGIADVLFERAGPDADRRACDVQALVTVEAVRAALVSWAMNGATEPAEDVIAACFEAIRAGQPAPLDAAGALS